MPHFLLRQKSYLRNGVMLLVISLIAVLWMAVFWNHQQSEDREVEDSRRQTETLALLFAKHTTATFKSVDLALMELRQTWTARPLELDAQIKTYSQFLGKAILQISIIDAKGFLVRSTLGIPAMPVFLGDREHFSVHQAGGEDKLFVSRPIKGRLLDKWAIQLTRPIFTQGKFDGVMVISVDPYYFVNFYEEANLGEDGVATMMRDTGEIMVRSSELGKYVGKIIKSSPYADTGAPQRGSFRRRSQNDGIERLFSYVRLPDYGLSVVIGPSVAERLVTVQGQQRHILLVASGVTLFALLMALHLSRTHLRKEAAQQALAESELRLRTSHELLENLTEHVPGMIFQLRLFPDGHSSIPYVSHGIRDVYELTPAQVRESANPLFANLHPDDYDAVRYSVAESAHTLQPWQQEFRVNLPTRGLRWLTGRAQPEKLADGGVLWHGFVTDITALKTTEADLRAANLELESFSYSVSHDLRGPLRTIDGFSQMLGKHLAGADQEKARYYLSRIHDGTRQMERLIADLLALARVARTPLRHAPVNLSALAGSIAEDLEARQPGRQVRLQIEPSLMAQGDTGLLRVVLENLLNNAWKYSAKQPVARIQVGQKPDATASPVFFVQDNGAGFDMAQAGKLFQPFERLHEAPEFEGTGVGLATVSRIIARHGGRIWAESAPGMGSTFFFTLPSAPLAFTRAFHSQPRAQEELSVI